MNLRNTLHLAVPLMVLIMRLYRIAVWHLTNALGSEGVWHEDQALQKKVF